MLNMFNNVKKVQRSLRKFAKNKGLRYTQIVKYKNIIKHKNKAF